MRGAVRSSEVAEVRPSFEEQFKTMLGVVDARPRLVVTRDRRILWQSANAATLLTAPVPLHISNGRLCADSPAAEASLVEFIEDLPGECESILLRGQSRRHWAMLLGWCPQNEADVVCLLLSLSVPHRGVAESGLARALRLTSAETRVLDQFARLNSPREIAEQMNVSLSTVRSHLKQIHSKAGVETAVQLTQLVRGFCSC